MMCCLKNEEDVYEEINRKMPNIGDIVTTDDGLKGEVANISVLRQMVRILVDVNDAKEVHDCKLETLHFVKKKPKRKNGKNGKSEEEAELENLEKIEQNDTKSKLDDN